MISRSQNPTYPRTHVIDNPCIFSTPSLPSLFPSLLLSVFSPHSTLLPFTGYSTSSTASLLLLIPNFSNFFHSSSLVPKPPPRPPYLLPSPHPFPNPLPLHSSIFLPLFLFASYSFTSTFYFLPAPISLPVPTSFGLMTYSSIFPFSQPNSLSFPCLPSFKALRNLYKNPDQRAQMNEFIRQTIGQRTG